MSIEKYRPTNLERVNPEFIGIAQKYSTYKKSRLTLQNQRDQLLSNLKYKMSVDKVLDCSLVDNQSKLRSVEKANRRHLAEIEAKKQRQESQKKKLVELNKTVHIFREENHQNIKNAISHVKNHKKMKSQTVKKMKDTMESTFRSTTLHKFQENKGKYREIKQRHRLANANINYFHREKNLESLNNYRQLIGEENKKTLQFSEDINRIQTTIDFYDKKIDRKRNRLFKLMREIGSYTSEPIEKLTKHLPMCLKETRTSSHYSSKPSEILLKGPANIINQDDTLHIQTEI